MNPNKKLIIDYIASLTDEQKNNILFQLIDALIDYEEIGFDCDGQMYNRHSGDRYRDIQE